MEDRHAVMKFTFAEKLAYVRGEGFQTPETSLPFKALSGFSGSENKMARPERFELPTNWFEASYSIQLSYGRILRTDLIVARGDLRSLPLLNQTEDNDTDVAHHRPTLKYFFPKLAPKLDLVINFRSHFNELDCFLFHATSECSLIRNTLFRGVLSNILGDFH